MNRCGLLVLCALFCLSGCAKKGTQVSGSPVRASARMPKGVELYSWKPAGEDWHFSLLPGTNRNKSVDEIANVTRTIIGVDDLKRHLAILAVGERVFWFPRVADQAGRPTRADDSIPLPPTDVVADLVHYCKGLSITLNIPCSATPAASTEAAEG